MKKKYSTPITMQNSGRMPYYCCVCYIHLWRQSGKHVWPVAKSHQRLTSTSPSNVTAQITDSAGYKTNIARIPFGSAGVHFRNLLR